MACAVTDQDLVFVGTFGKLAAVHKPSGVELWRRADLSPATAGFVTLHVEFGILFVGTAGQIWALRPSDGVELWRNPLKGLGFAAMCFTTNTNKGLVPVFTANDDVCAAAPLPPQMPSRDTTAAAVVAVTEPVETEAGPEAALLPTSATPPSTTTTAAGGVADQGPVLFAGTNGHVVALSALTGIELWRTSIPGTGYSIATLLYERDAVLVGTQGSLLSVQAATGAIRWKNDLKGMGFLPMCLATTHISMNHGHDPLPQMVRLTHDAAARKTVHF